MTLIRYLFTKTIDVIYSLKHKKNTFLVLVLFFMSLI